MVGLFTGLYKEKLVKRAESLGVERGRVGGFEKFLAAMHPDGAIDLATITSSKLAEPGYAGILRLLHGRLRRGSRLVVVGVTSTKTQCEMLFPILFEVLVDNFAVIILMRDLWFSFR